jgi:glycosyltransferase involved in cell wall biosynthesis
MLELARLSRRLKPEVIHSYGFFTNFAAYFAARAWHAIALGSVRGEIDLRLSQTRPLLGRLSAWFPPNQISNSNAAAKLANSSFQWFRPRTMTVVPNALDLQRFQNLPLPIDHPRRILGIGSLIPLKRWDKLLKIAQELKLRNLSCVVEIAGEGPLRQDLEAQAAAMGIADVVRFLGYRKDIPELIAKARVVVHTADNEGSPNAVMEAMASGRPVIATDAGDVGQLIETGKTGFVVPRDDQALLLKRIIEVLTDDALAVSLGQAARSYAQREFQLSRLAERTLQVYQSLGWRP